MFCLIPDMMNQACLPIRATTAYQSGSDQYSRPLVITSYRRHTAARTPGEPLDLWPPVTIQTNRHLPQASQYRYLLCSEISKSEILVQASLGRPNAFRWRKQISITRSEQRRRKNIRLKRTFIVNAQNQMKFSKRN